MNIVPAVSPDGVSRARLVIAAALDFRRSSPLTPSLFGVFPKRADRDYGNSLGASGFVCPCRLPAVPFPFPPSPPPGGLVENSILRRRASMNNEFERARGGAKIKTEITLTPDD